MSYPLRNSSKPRNGKWRVKSAVAILLFATVFLFSRVDLFRGFLNKIALPFWKIDNYAVGKFSDFFSVIGSKNSLVAENRRLEEELTKANAELSIQKVIEKENDDLKSLFERSDTKMKVILGVVLKKPVIYPFDIIIIDIGKTNGLQKGDKVLYGGVIAMGQIEEVFEKSSKVKLYSSPGQKFTVFIGSKSIQTEAEGLGGGNFMVKLPKGVEVSEGDEAVVPGISTTVFGFAHKIETDPADSFQKIIFKIPFNLNELKWVEVEVK